MRILVVEDEPAMSGVELEQNFVADGYAVTTVGDGVAAAGARLLRRPAWPRDARPVTRRPRGVARRPQTAFRQGYNDGGLDSRLASGVSVVIRTATACGRRWAALSSWWP
jgi:hypothetical protein